LASLLATMAAACVADVGSNPTPVSMEFDLTSTPPRAPQPSQLIINPATGRIDFSLAGTPIPADCSTQQALTQAQCQFDQFLETLDGFPSVTPAAAPATAALDPASLTVGQNVVVMATRTGLPNTSVTTGFDAATSSLTVTPTQPWNLGELYWIGVRGYANGVKAVSGLEVVGSPTMALLKQDTPLTCGATDPSQVDPQCPAFRVLAQGTTPAQAAAQLFQLQAVWTLYQTEHGFDLMAAAGLPKSETAVLWGFPIQTASVAVLAPSAGAVPMVVAPDQLRVGVQGTVDPTTVSAFVASVVVAGGARGSVVVADLSAAPTDVAAFFPPVTATFASGFITITASAPFVTGHQIGIFFTNAIKNASGVPLVASPVSVLLTLTAPLVDSAGHSTVAGVSDADAAALEAGRQALAPLFDTPSFTTLTGVTRQNLVYDFAFQVPP
jgi:hypothetical protein